LPNSIPSKTETAWRRNFSTATTYFFLRKKI
jgi:hypothetical protein